MERGGGPRAPPDGPHPRSRPGERDIWVREQEVREKRERRYALARQKLLEAEMAPCGPPPTGAGGHDGIDHDKTCLRFPYDSTFL